MMPPARWRNASTRERCNALYPGSNPGRASTLRPDGLRVAEPRRTGGANIVRHSSMSQAKARDGLDLAEEACARRRTGHENRLISRLMAGFLGFAGAETGLKTTGARGLPSR